MFEVGIKETDNQLTELEKKLKNIVTNYGKLELKVQVDGLKAFTAALESIGQSKGLDALQKRIDVLQVTLANVGMSGAKSIQEFEAAVKTTSAVAEQYTQRINQMTAARDKFANGSTQWMSLNNKLTDFQNDKQVIAIYAQEQVAIKNLEDAKARLSNTNAEEVESYQKVISSIKTLSTAANTLKTVLGSWDAGKGNIAQLVEQFEKLHKEISGIATSLKGIDPSKLNFSGLNINVGNIAGLGDLNSAIRGLEVSINDIIRLFSNLANAVKLQPLDDQIKALLERCERAETKLREVGEAARYLNERAGERTQQKSQNIAGIAGLNEENVERVSNLFERYRKLLADVQNQTANIGGIQNVAEKLGLNQTIVDQAAKRFEALWKTIENSMAGMEKYKGFPVLDQSSDQLAKLRAEFSALLSEYKLVTQESNNYNKATERNAKAEQARLEKAAAVQQKIDEMRQKTFSNLGIRENDPGMQNMQTALDNIMQKLTKVREDIDLYRAAIGQGSKESIDFGQKGLKEAESQAETLMRQYAALYEAMERLRSGGNERPLLSTVQQNKELEMLNEAYRKGASELQKKAKAEDEAQKAAERSAKAQQRAQERIQNAAKRTSENLGTLTDRLDAKKLNFKGMDFTELDTAIGKIRAIKAELENFATTGRSSFGNTAKEIVQTMGLSQANEEARIAVGHLTTGKREAEKANKELSDSEQRLANAVKGTSDSMRGQSQVLSDLKMMATQYLSVWGAQSFISNIIETGGLLEQQRLSLSAILGDMGKAQTLFDQIKGMALKSPFGVVELDKMSKQLAAYSFEYEELFDWTKRLADISAATGTSVDRLALALGHVRSEGALSGYTLRQFAMANVPVLRMLSENLGISTKEVRERVKKKEISAEDVQDILKQLTEDGGMFANAQETMSEALNAKFKNLRDAFDIMYGEIAESGVGDKLKDLAVILTNGAKHWERLANDVKDVAIAFGIGKLAMLMYNTALGKGTAITLKSALASKQKEIANLELTASYRKLTASEQATMANATKLNATNISTLLSTKKLTYAELERAVALGKVDKAVALSALGMQKMHKQMALLRQIAPLQGFARIWAILTYNIKLASAAVKSFMASAWPLLALTAVFELWNRRSEQRDNANDMAKNMAGNTRGREAYEMRDSLADSRKLSSEALKQNISEMQEALIAANAYTDELKKQVDATNDLATKYDLLKDKIGEVSDAYEEHKNAQEAMLKDAWGAVEGEWYNPASYFEDNMLEDTKQFDTAMAEFQKKLTIASKQIKGVLSEWLQNQGLYDEAYAKMTGKQIFESLGKDTQSSFLNYAWNARGLDDTTSEMLRDISVAYNKVGDKLADMSGEQGEKFANIMKAIYEESFHVDLSKADQEQVNAFDKWLKDTLARAEGLSNDAKEALRNIVIDFTVTLKPNYVVDQPQTPQEVVASQIGDNKWLSGFFGRQNGGIPSTWTPEQAQKEVKKYKQLFGDISLSNLDTAPKKLNTLLDGLEETKKNLQNTLSNGLLSDEENAEIQKSLAETSDSIDKANKALKDVGAKRQRKGDKSGKKNLDTERAKAVREQVRVIKEAADAYQYWRDKVGDESAWEHVKSEFGDVLHDIGITAQNIQDVRGQLKRIPLMKEYREITDQKVKTEIDKERAKEEDQFIRKDFEKQTEEFLSKTKIKLDQLTRSWKTFNTVRDATGDINLAVKISGADFQFGVAENIAEELKKRIEKSMKDVGINPIELNVEWSDKDIENAVHDAFAASKPVREKGESEDDYKKRLQEYEAHIKSIVEETKKWRDLETELRDNAVTTYVNLLKDADSLTQKVRTANTEYEKQIEHLRVLRDLQVGDKNKISNDEYERLSRKADVNRKLTIASDLTSTLDWSATSQFFGKVFTDAGETLRNYLSKFISSDEFKGMDVTQQKKYLDLQANIDKSSGKYAQPLSPATWSNLAKKTKNVQDAFVDLVAKTKELEEAKQDEKDAAQALEDARKNGTGESEASYRLLQATSNRVSAENAVNQANKEVIQAEQERRTAEEEAVRGLNGLNSALGNITSGSLVELTMGFGNLIEMFSGKKNLSGTLSELLGGTSGTGQIIAAVLQLLDMLKDKSAEKVEEMLRGMFDAVVGILKDFLTGKLTEAIIEASIEGIGKIVEAIVENIPNMAMGGIGGLLKGEGIVFKSVEGLVKGLGSGFGNAIEGLLGVDFNNSNEAEVRESIERLNKENERLATVIEEATKELKESNGMRAVNAAKEARDAQTQYNANIMNKWREGMGYHSAHHSNSYSWDLEDSTQDEVNAALRAYAEKTGKELKQINVDNWEEFMTLTPEEMDYIRKHAQGAWEDITTEGKYEWVHEYLNEYADQAGKLEEMSEELREKLTLQSVSGLHDQFVNELMDMDKSAKDFSKDFSKMLMKAVLNAQIADLLDDQLKQWRDTMATYMEEDGDFLSPAHIAELQKMWDNIVAQGLKIRDNVASAVGYTGEGSSSGLSSNIKNISEQTADILASYLNAVRADVAVNRQMISQYFPMYYQAMTTGNQSLKNIENHTSAIMQSNETIANRISALDDKFNGLKNGTWRMPVA